MAEPQTTPGPQSGVRAAAARAWDGTRRFLATRHGKLIAAGTAAVLIIGAGSSAVFAASRSDDGRYRTATAQTGEVAETLSLTGQVSSSSSSSAAFQVSGTVGAVLVTPGDTVTAGQALASLDDDDLTAAVTNAEDSLASAKQQLEDDLDAQSSGTSSSTSTAAGGSSSFSAPSGGSGSTPSGGSGETGGAGSGGSSGGAGSGGGSGSSSSVSDDPQVVAAEKAVTAAQTALLDQYDVAKAAQDDSSTAAANAQEVCKPFLGATLNADGTIDSDAEADAATDDLSATQDLLTSCQSAISDTLDKQKATSAAQDLLNDKATALDDAVTALQKAIAAPEAAASGSSTATGSYRTGSSSLVVTTASYVTTEVAADSDTGSGGASGRSTTITSEQILADQAQIDLARANLAVAKQNLTFATLKSPIAGTVVDVGVAVGDSVSAGSTSAVITVQGAGGYVVQTTVSLSKIADVAAGQTAKVTLPALAKSYDATVSSIGVLNESSTSTPSYAVTLSIDAGDDQLRIGATAQAEVSLSTAKDVLTVPTSAVTITGKKATVLVLAGGKARTASVEVGAIGAERTEITKGLEAGDLVVLADLTKAIDSGDSDSSTSLSDLGGDRSGSFTRGQFPSGSFPPSGN